MNDFSSELPPKVSSNPQIQSRVDTEKGDLSKILSSTGINEQGLNHVARQNVAKQIRIERAVNRAQEAEKNTMIDPLTGLYNRGWFEKEIRRQAAEHNREMKDKTAKTLWLLFIDLDHFKWVNDQYGHQTGDAILQRMRTLSVRPAEPIARYGGEEFVQIVQGTDIDGIAEIIKRHSNTMREESRNALSTRRPQAHINPADALREVTLSIGVTRYDPNEPVEDFIKRADDAVYEAKQHERNQAVLATKVGINDVTHERVRLQDTSPELMAAEPSKN